MLAVAHPDLMGFILPAIELVALDEAAIGAKAGIFGRGGLGRKRLQHRTQAVSSNYNVGCVRISVFKGHSCSVSGL